MFDRYAEQASNIAEQCNMLLRKAGPISDIQCVDVDTVGQFCIHIADRISDDLDSVFEYLVSVLPDEYQTIAQLRASYRDLLLTK